RPRRADRLRRRLGRQRGHSGGSRAGGAGAAKAVPARGTAHGPRRQPEPRRSAMTAPAIRTGIGGWVYPEWRGGAFYLPGLAQKRELEWASRQLGAIEINATYHRLQKPQSFRNWRDQTPEGFVFAVKGSSYVTNRKVLAEAGPSLDRFFAQGIEELGDRLGPILWQLMATKRFDPDDLAAFFALLPQDLGGIPLRHAIEVG